ncbi:MAG: pentapeptide repeat-containing protein, partial [Arenicellales bacterium]|nr:pentapeptide repeat-containing protein [Arenicellales bacterium]
EGVMPSHVILQAVAGEDVEKLTSQVATPEPQGCDEGTPSGVDSANDRRCLQERKDPDRRWSSPASCIACDLSNIDLVGADLSGASLLNANLSGANLTSANLTSANLTNANLTNAKLSNANLKQAYINGADLASADLTGANLTYAVISRRTQTDGAIFCNTIMMEGTTNNVDCPCPSDDSSCPSDTATLFGIGEYEKLVYWGEVSAVPPGFEHPLATKAGIPHGQGTLSTPEGTLVGEFRHGEPWEVTGYEKDEDSVLTPKGQKGKVLGTVSEGRMIETFKWYGPGDNIGDCIYKGQTNNRQQQPHGQGTITCYDGAKFVGEWKVGEMWEGVETFPAKYMPGVCPCTTDMSGGTNQNGNPVNAKMVDKDGDTLVTWTEGKCKGSDEYCPEVFR